MKLKGFIKQNLQYKKIKDGQFAIILISLKCFSRIMFLSKLNEFGSKLVGLKEKGYISKNV